MQQLPGTWPALTEDARFAPYDDAIGQPHMVVDGPATAMTVLGLSHWPDGGVPTELAADTSTEIAARYVDAQPTGPDVSIVTNNHYDEDGVLAAHVALARLGPGPARDLAIDAAHAGDFHTWARPEAMRVALALMAMAERGTTPLPDVARALNRARGRDPAGEITIAVLPHVGPLLDDPDRYRLLWTAGWHALEADVALLDSGEATITEHPDLDVTVVRSRTPLRLGAICPRTSAMRLVHAWGDGHIGLEHRYETWVRYTSRALTPRRDLSPVLAGLDRATTAPGTWRFEGIEHPRGRLTFTDTTGRAAPSGLSVETFLDALASID